MLVTDLGPGSQSSPCLFVHAHSNLELEMNEEEQQRAIRAKIYTDLSEILYVTREICLYIYLQEYWLE